MKKISTITYYLFNFRIIVYNCVVDILVQD